MPANVPTTPSSDGTSCATCRWWRATPAERQKVPYPMFRAHCQVRSPSADPVSLHAVWPTCASTDWCGVWTAIPVPAIAKET